MTEVRPCLHELAAPAEERPQGPYETITDQTGTYAAPAPSPGVVGLTSGNDTFVAPSSGSTVYATAATLNPGDSLTGGAGTDVLALVGDVNVSIDQLATFTLAHHAPERYKFARSSAARPLKWTQLVIRPFM